MRAECRPLISRWPGALVRNLAPTTAWTTSRSPAGDTTLRALQTPGHAPDHLLPGRSHADVLWRPREAGRDHRHTASAGGSLVQYLDSLRRIRALSPRRLLPGHGPVIDDPVTLIDSTWSIGPSAKHRCSTALRSGASSVDALVQRIYTNLHPTVVRAAADSMLAHLIKLRDEGRVMERDGEWREVGR